MFKRRASLYLCLYLYAHSISLEELFWQYWKIDATFHIYIKRKKSIHSYTIEQNKCTWCTGFVHVFGQWVFFCFEMVVKLLKYICFHNFVHTRTLILLVRTTESKLMVKCLFIFKWHAYFLLCAGCSRICIWQEKTRCYIFLASGFYL